MSICGTQAMRAAFFLIAGLLYAQSSVAKMVPKKSLTQTEQGDVLTPEDKYHQASQGAKIVALVNDRVITQRDLDQRVRLTLLMNQVPLTKANWARALPEVRQLLIHEAMKLSLSTKFDLLPDIEEVRGMIENISNANPQLVGGVQKLMKQNKIPENVFALHVSAEIAWRNYLQARFQPQLQVTSGEVDDVIQGLQNGKIYPSISDQLTEEMFSFSQIIFPFKSNMKQGQRQHLLEVAQSVQRRSTTGQQFLTMIKKQPNVQVSEKTDIPASHMPQDLKTLLKDLKNGDVSEPVVTSMGVVVFVMNAYTPRPTKFSPVHIRQALSQKKFAQIDLREMHNLIRDSHVDVKN